MALVTSGVGNKWRARVENGVVLEEPGADCPLWLRDSLLAAARRNDRWDQELQAHVRAGGSVDTSGT